MDVFGAVLGFFFPAAVVYICLKLILNRFFKIYKTSTIVLIEAGFFISLWLLLRTVEALFLFSLLIMSIFIYVFEEEIRVKKQKIIKIN